MEPGVAIVVAAAEPVTLVAVNWNSYCAPSVKPVIVADVSVGAGAVHVSHFDVPDSLYSSV